MSYIPNVWSSNDIVTAEKLNYIESGIEGSRGIFLQIDLTDYTINQENENKEVTYTDTRIKKSMSVLYSNWADALQNSEWEAVICYIYDGQVVISGKWPEDATSVVIYLIDTDFSPEEYFDPELHYHGQCITPRVTMGDIINNLTSTEMNKPLSAAQGKALNDAISALVPSSVITSSSKTTHVFNVPSNSRHLLVCAGSSNTTSFVVVVLCTSNGTVTFLELAKGSNLTFSTNINTFTATYNTANGFIVADIILLGSAVTVS